MHSFLEANPLRESTLRAVIETLQLPSGSRGLDAGCGTAAFIKRVSKGG